MYDIKNESMAVEFHEMLKSNKYITFKEYNNFLDKYQKILKNDKESIEDEIKEIINNGYSYIEKHNNLYINNKLEEEKEYFDKMFENIDPSIKLDEEQRRAIVNEEDYSLIIAGAGAGKTTTMAAKVKYLIEKCNVLPSKIAVISYTNKATEELEDRIKYEFHLPVDIMTFHSLGIKIIRTLFSQPLKPVSDVEKDAIISNYVSDVLFKDKALLNEYVETFNKYQMDGINMFSKGFVENYLKFDTFEEYFRDYKRRKQEQNKDNLLKIIKYQIEKSLKLHSPKSLKNETMKSKAEAKIANFLFVNGIDYKYEEPYPEKVDQEKAYLPDFTIEVNGISLYIEYYGLSKVYENGTISDKDKEKYNAIRKKKREFHKLNNNNYIELDYNVLENGKIIDYLDDLKRQLIEHGVTFKKRSLEEIYDQILDNNVHAEFFRFIDFCNGIISSIKSDANRENIKNVIDNYIINLPVANSVKNEMFREKELLLKLYNYYESELWPKNRIDFSDMIYYANKYMNELQSADNKLNYDYIIIDEYQDISLERYEFAKNVSQTSNAKVISVGDDWQTIFSFAGSRIDLFYKYTNQFPGAKQLFINSTYRNSQELIDIAGQFVMKNPLQIKKYLLSEKKRHKPIKICYYNYNQYDLVEKIIGQIIEENPDDHILILARKNRHIEKLLGEGNFEQGLDTRIISKKYPQAHIDAMSVHKAKGLGADQVIILNVTNDDFPNVSKTDFWLVELFKPEIFDEKFPYAEDRRIFYVALTRTKKDVYLLTPENEEKQSLFIEELKNL